MAGWCWGVVARETRREGGPICRPDSCLKPSVHAADQGLWELYKVLVLVSVTLSRRGLDLRARCAEGPGVPRPCDCSSAPRGNFTAGVQVLHGAPDFHAAPWRMGRAGGRTATCLRGSSDVDNGQYSTTAATTAVLNPVLDVLLSTDFLMPERHAVLGYGVH